MKPKLNFIHVCDYASSSEGGKLNVLGIFENIFSNNIPVIHPQLYVVTNITINEQKVSFKEVIKIIKESDGSEIIKPLELNITVPSNTSSEAKVGFIGQFNSVKFEEFSSYLIQIFIDSEKIGEQRITLTQPPNIKVS